MSEARIYLHVNRSADVCSHEFLLFHGEETVRIYSYHHGIGLDGLLSRLNASTPPADIVAVQGISKAIIRIGVEPVYKFFALVLLI